jgi:Fic family protein
MSTLLLYQNGFYVGKYISLEAKIAKHKDLYYEALRASQTGWHEGKDDPVPFIKYLLGTILAAYREFEDRYVLIETAKTGDSRPLNPDVQDQSSGSSSPCRPVK